MKLCPANGAFWRGAIVARLAPRGNPIVSRKSRIFNYLGYVPGKPAGLVSHVRHNSPSRRSATGPRHPCGTSRAYDSHSPGKAFPPPIERIPTTSPLGSASGESFMTNGNGAPPEQAPPQLNVLAQYTKDLSFE